MNLVVYMRHTPTGNPRMHGVVPSYGTLIPSLRGTLLGDPLLDLF